MFRSHTLIRKKSNESTERKSPRVKLSCKEKKPTQNTEKSQRSSPRRRRSPGKMTRYVDKTQYAGDANV